MRTRDAWILTITAALVSHAGHAWAAWPLTLLGLSLLFLALFRHEPRPFLKAGLFGALLMGLQMIWLPRLVWLWTESIALAAIPTLVVLIAATLLFGTAGVLLARAFRAGFWPLIPFAWAGFEALRAYIPGLAFPWAIAGHPMFATPVLAGAAGFGTVFLLSAMLAAVALMPCVGRRNAFRMVAPIALLIGFGSIRMARPIEGTPIVVAAIQPGVPMPFTPLDQRRARLDGAVQPLLSELNQASPNLVVLPEGFSGLTFGEDPPESLFGNNPGAVLPDAAVLFGAQRQDGEVTYQTAYGFDEKWHYADKTRLVVFGEYVPLRNQLPFLRNFRLPAGDLTPARELKAISLFGLPIAQQLCFEGLFPDLADRQQQLGARVIAVMSIDDWYSDPTWPRTWWHRLISPDITDQLAQASLMRAIESGMPVVRAASNGESLIADEKGQVLSRSGGTGTHLLINKITVPNQPSGLPNRFAFVVFCWLCLAACLFVRPRPNSGNPNPANSPEDDQPEAQSPSPHPPQSGQ